ncbi:hypothetical protein [Gilvimarinus agarilyticus]|uniref:hypothetical protein n=1 Tax=Gilvimarinus agarilyticus TaxID=679259 RepID=UPI00059F5FCA|nr:hypothetical protein [Gilvimarinus agarilyticus]
MTKVRNEYSFDTLCIGAPLSFMLDESIIPKRNSCVAMVPAPDYSEALKAYVNSNVKVVGSLVSCLGRDTYYEFNVPEYNGVSEPSGIKAFYPGFRLVQQYEIETMELAEAVALVDNTAGRRQLLICIPNVAYQIISDLVCNKKMELFSRVQVVAAEHGIYGGASSDFDARDLLIENGYSAVAVRQVEAGLVYYDFCLSPLKASLEEVCRKLEDEVASKCDLNDQLKRQSQLVADIKLEKAEALEAGELYQHKCSSLEQDLDRVKSKLLESQFFREEVEKNYKKEIGQCKKESEQFLASARELQAQLKSREAVRMDAEREAGEFRRLFEEMELERDFLQEENAKLESDSASKASKIDLLQADVDKFKKQASNRAKRIQVLEDALAKLEKDHYDVNHKNELMHQELVKAEAQISMIKDFVLRD